VGDLLCSNLRPSWAGVLIVRDLPAGNPWLEQGGTAGSCNRVPGAGRPWKARSAALRRKDA